MRLTRLRLRDVKRHADLELGLAPGLTVIRGPNEAGKTTIQRAIEMALFRKATSTAQEMDGVRRWGAGDPDPRVDLDFEADGRTGRLTKVFGGQRGSVELVLDGQALSDASAVDHVVAELTGLPSEKFFRSTANVRHHELDDLDRDEGALRDRLQQSMSGADGGTWVARRKLEDAIRRYRTEGPKNPGHLKRAREEVADLEAEVQRGEAGLARLALDRQALAEAHERRVALDARLAAEQRGLETSERAVALQARLEEVHARYGRYKRAAEVGAELGRREAAHPSPVPLPTLRAEVERVRALEHGISEQRVELAGIADTSGVASPIVAPAWRPLATAAGVAVAVAAILGIVGLLGTGTLAYAGAALLFTIALGFGAEALRRRARGDAARRENDRREQEIARRAEARAALVERIRANERERDARLGALGLPDPGAAEQVLVAEADHMAAIGRLEAELSGLVGGASPDEATATVRDALAAEADEIRHALGGMGEIGADPAKNRGRYVNAVRATQAERERALAEEAAARARVERDPVDAEEVAELGERLAGAREHLATLTRRVAVYELTLASIDDAEKLTMKKAARFLEERMATDVERITDGRYRRVRVDEDQLTFSVYSAERDDWVDVRTLSRGTLDQFYLAARLGLVRQVTRHRRPPLIFDDPFVTFDDDRARRAVELLKELAADHQVIYLTCSERYDPVADLVIELPAPTARDDEESVHRTMDPRPAVLATAMPGSGSVALQVESARP